MLAMNKFSASYRYQPISSDGILSAFVVIFIISFSIGCSSGLHVIKYQHSRKLWPLCVMQRHHHNYCAIIILTFKELYPNYRTKHFLDYSLLKLKYNEKIDFFTIIALHFLLYLCTKRCRK